MSKRVFYPFIMIYISAIVYLAYTTPITPHEANIFYSDNGIVNFLMHYGYDIFGGFIGIRLFFTLIGFISIYLYYSMTAIYLERESDRYSATTLYLILPGIITALVLANISILVIPLVLIFLISYDKDIKWLQIAIMGVLFFIHEASVIFFITILIYGFINKNRLLTLSSGIFLTLSIIIARGVEIGGRPSGHFIDIFGLYTALFSPLIFIYFFYTLYRILLREEKNILWYISFGALIVSLLLSIRQRISITDFAPYVIISVVLMLDSFNRRLRVRLPIYQKYYKIGFIVVISTLISVSLLIVLHQPLFVDRGYSFTDKLYEPFNLAKELKAKNIDCYSVDKRDKVYQLRFYGIESCPRYEFKE